MFRACESKFVVLLVLTCLPIPGSAGTVTEIIAGGHTLRGTHGIAMDDSGNAYVTGSGSSNTFRIELCDTLDDYPLFESCLTEPGGVADPSCSCPDDDGDGDVDLVDFGRLQLTFVGP